MKTTRMAAERRSVCRQISVTKKRKALTTAAQTIETYGAAISLARDHSIAFYDVLVLATAIEAGRDRLYSEDFLHGRRFGECTVVNRGPRTFCARSGANGVLNHCDRA